MICHIGHKMCTYLYRNLSMSVIKGEMAAVLRTQLRYNTSLHTFIVNSYLFMQTGLMWRQTGPIIISMTYMIIDVLVFLFIFVVVYISFTLVTVYVYEVYDNDRTQFFNTHKSAFKLFWWSLIRTGNPHFPNIREYEETLHYYNTTCIGNLLGQVMMVIS